MEPTDRELQTAHFTPEEQGKMHAIILASLRFCQLRTEYDEFDIAAEEPEICGRIDLHSLSDSDFDEAVAWLHSISPAPAPPTPPGYEDF